jgi:hypothetical protein
MRLCCRLAGLSLGLLTLAACTPQSALQGPPSDPLEMLGAASLAERPPQLRVQPLATGNETPYTPVMLPPDVRRAFVRGHTNAHRDLIGGHWWYVRLEDWAWPVERETRLTLSSAPAHVPRAPALPRSQTPKASQHKSRAAALPGATPSQQPLARGATPSGTIPLERLPALQALPSPKDVPLAMPSNVPAPVVRPHTPPMGLVIPPAMKEMP